MKVVGLMSGTSLDGLDLILVDFQSEKEYNVIKTQTVKYDSEWQNRLAYARQLSGGELAQLNVDYGIYLGNCVNAFIDEKIDLIASHGHTVFHQPAKSLTLQIGSLQHIYAATGVPTVGDFRVLDVAKGGQGAPLVPIGDALLFGDFDYCLNLGGISNVSFVNERREREAFDVSPCNIVANLLAEKLGKAFDENGELAKKGEVNSDLLQRLNAWSYYQNVTSLGIEAIEESFLPMFFRASNLPVNTQLATYYRHLGLQIGKVLKGGKTLITGGGAHNTFLVNELKKHSETEIIVPKKETIDFKEALIFALLGYLRLEGKINILASVTGASSDSCSGTVIV